MTNVAPIDPAPRGGSIWGRLVAWAAGIVRIAWVCRVSVLNVAVSLLFFGYIVQAQNLMADLSSWGSWREFVFWAGVFGLSFLFWAFPVHYGARRSLDQLRRMAPTVRAQHRCLVRWFPRLLGLMPFAALAFGIHGARASASGADPLLPAAAQTMTQGFWLYIADGVTAAAFVAFVYGRRSLPRWMRSRCIHPFAGFATAAIFLAAYVAPIETSVHVPRALLVPPLFGSLVLGASWLTRVGDRTGFPFLATLALLLGVSTGLNTNFDDLRTLPKATARLAGDQRLSVDAAVTAWKAANDCSTTCPHPIVIAIDGGASRAAFTAATFVGELLDRMPEPARNEARTPGRRIFAISGVSGGSYGAAVIQSALLEAQRTGDGKVPPCRSAQRTWFGYQAWHDGGNIFNWRQCLQALTSGDYLSSTIIGLAFRDLAAPPWQWIGLPAMADRAAILEMTWERQFAATLEAGLPFYEGGDLCRDDEDGGLCRRMAHPAAYLAAGGAAPRWMPMLLLNGTSVATGRRIVSSDLASTKVGTGPDAPPGGPLYSQAFDLREAMSEQCPSTAPPVEPAQKTGTAVLAEASARGDDERTLTNGVCAATPAPIDGPDVRLSTAALTSARFPLISPAGIFRMRGSGYGDQVVDGGYFENSGLTTALDIVHALADRKIQATVVSISNNPAYDAPDATQETLCEQRFEAHPGDRPFSPAQCTGVPRRPATTPLVPPTDNSFLGRFFGLLYRPFETLVATGDGHSDELMALIAAHPPGGGFVHLQVMVAPSFDPAPPDGASVPRPDSQCDELTGKHMTMAQVSMSWWLSAAVQADLDIQRCAWRNRVQLQKLVDGLATTN